MTEKQCGSCSEWKDIDQFHKGSGKHGRVSYCKLCVKLYRKQNKEKTRAAAQRWRENNQDYMQHYREQNKERLREYDRWYYDKNAEQFRERTRQWREQNPERRKEQLATYYQQNRERELEKSRQRHLKNREANCKRAQEWRRNNKDRVASQIAKRRCAEKCAIPSWVDFEQIELLYAQASHLTEQTGIPHQVDHIIPLNSDFVCGLHCADNLRVITAEENNKKKNQIDESLL